MNTNQSDAALSRRPSPAQEGLWSLTKLEDIGSAYNRGTALYLRGPLQVEKLALALTALLARHETLRSSYPAVDGIPVVRISPPAPVQLEVEDLSESQQDLETVLLRASAYLHDPYDLENGPLFRCRLYRLADKGHLLVLGDHEIVSDAAGWNTILTELAALYTEQVTGQPAGLNQPAISYFELVARRQAESAQDDESEANGLAYWKEHLRGAPPLEFPTSRPRPSVQGHKGDVIVFKIDAALKSKLEAIGREQAATPFMVFLALFKLFLARYARQRDLVVGIAEAGRSDPDSAGVVGFFLNTLAIRTQLTDDMSFRDLLEQVFINVLGGVEYANIPFERVVQHLELRRDPSRSPVFQAMLTFKERAANLRFAGLETTEQDLPRHGSMFDLALYLTDLGSEMRAELEYNTDLFDREFMHSCAGQFIALLERVAADPDAPALGLAWLDNAQIDALVKQHSGISDPTLADGTFLEWVAAQVQATPEHVAAADDAGNVLSYAQLWDLAARVASGLASQGLPRNSLIGVHLQRGVTMPGVVLGILRSGAAYLPLDPDFPPDRLSYMVEDSGTCGVISDDPAATFGDVTVWSADEILGIKASPESETLPGPNELAYVIYTSGSTGRPKGVQIEHGALRNFLGAMQTSLTFTPEDTLLAVTTLSFDIAGLELFLPLCAGARVVIPATEVAADGDALIDLLDESQATAMQATPATWRMLLDAGWSGRLPRILCGGEALPVNLARELLDRGMVVWNMYGPTETTIWSTLAQVQQDTPITIGRPLTNTRVYILDEFGNLVPEGMPGEIWIAGAGVARGYLNRPELTAERFRPDPFVQGERMYRTGDLGRWDMHGQLEHLGRIDFQVKVHGFRIELGEIETALQSLPEILQAVVAAKGEAEDKRLVAYVVFHPGQELLSGEIRRRLRQTLPDYMVPGLVVPMNDFPLTPNGKVDRLSLPDPLEGSIRKPDYEPAEGPIENAIAEVWQTLLDVERVGRHDNFFELGGHSLLAMRAVAGLDKRLPGMRLQPREMYYLSVAQLAAVATSDSVPTEGHGV